MAKVSDASENMVRCICSDCKNFKDFDPAGGYQCADGWGEEGPQ